jgi:molybdenum cofactor biosynthesis enzyme MoaA
MNLIYNFEITNFCNLKCKTCPRTVGNITKLNHMKYDDFEELILFNLKQFKNTICKFCGEFGDPLTHPELHKFISISSKYFDQVLVYTNGSLRNSDWFYRIMDTYLNLNIHFGVDGFTQEINNIFRVNSDIDKIKKNIESASMIDPMRVKVDYTVFDWNKNEIDSMKKFCDMLNVKINIRKDHMDFS